MSNATLACLALMRANIAFTPHAYAYDPEADKIGMHAAAALGFAPARVLKTLMLTVDGKAACAVIPSDRDLSMKKTALAFGGKAAAMMKPQDAEKCTGYHIGGISPFGQKRTVPTVFDGAALGHTWVCVNGGRRGLLLELNPADAIAVLGALTADVTAREATT